MITSFLALEPTIQRHGRLSIGLSLEFHFIARQQEGASYKSTPRTRLNFQREATTTSPSKEKEASTK